MKTLRIVSRVIIGITFMFSGFVKGVDPMGTMYKIEDYFVAYHLDWAMPLAIYLSFALVTLEFIIGVFLLLNIRMKEVTWVLTALMSFFTLVTLYDALFNPVPDCGCFGEAIKLTNWQTFYKNIVLMVFTLILVFTAKYSKKTFPLKMERTAGVLFTLAFLMFVFYNHQNLPAIDFREWKEGRNMKQSGKAKYYLVYKNKTSGETRAYLSSELPYNDSTWMENWEFVKQKIDYSQVNRKHHLQIVDYNGNDHTREIVENPNYQFIITSHSLDKAKAGALRRAAALYDSLSNKGYDFVVLTSSLKERSMEFQANYNTDIGIYQADDIELKTMVRANPGMILLKNGIILEKWHHSNLPGEEEILKHYPVND